MIARKSKSVPTVTNEPQTDTAIPPDAGMQPPAGVTSYVRYTLRSEKSKVPDKAQSTYVTTPKEIETLEQMNDLMKFLISRHPDDIGKTIIIDWIFPLEG